MQAYASGCNIVILSSDFQRVQIVPGAVYGSDVQVTCVSCSSDVGKVSEGPRTDVEQHNIIMIL